MINVAATIKIVSVLFFAFNMLYTKYNGNMFIKRNVNAHFPRRGDRVQKSEKGRKQKHHRHSCAEKRGEKEAEAFFHKAHKGYFINNTKCKKRKNDEKNAHITNVVIGKEAERQSQNVEGGFSFSEQHQKAKA